MTDSCDAICVVSRVSEVPWSVILCYGGAVFAGVAVALIELLSRFGPGNHPSWVLVGIPQIAYFALNACVAGMSLFSSEALGQSDVVSLFATAPPLAVLKAAGVGVLGMFALRSSLFSIESKGQKGPKVEVGPAHVLSVFNRYLDRQIDQKRSGEAYKRVAKLMSGVPPDAIYPDILLCIAAAESIPDEVGTKLKLDIERLMTQKNWKNPSVKAIAVGLEIHRELGSDTLESVVASIREAICSSGERGGQSETNALSNPEPCGAHCSSVKAVISK